MCGIIGIYDKEKNNDLINETLSRLKEIQHRGKDSWGISYINNKNIHKICKKGLLNNDNKINIPINQCIGHVRYTTSKGDNSDDEIQPLTNHMKRISIVHNGNIPIFKGHDTTELFNIMLNHDIFENKLVEIMDNIVASYSLIIMIENTFYIMKDRYGIRPLCFGKKDNKIIISSESCALKGSRYVNEVRSGQILKINQDGIFQIYLHPKSIDGICIFEFLYFMNKDSIYKNTKVEEIRFKLGEMLAKKEKLISKDYIVVGIPSSGISAAISYAKFLNLEYSQSIKKNNNNSCDRTFIIPENPERIKQCKEKFKYSIDYLKNKKIIIVDDTIVRGNIIKTIISELKYIGVSEIHIRIPAPPVIDICQLGIAINNKEELLMNNRTINEVKNILQIDSLNFLEYNELNKMYPDAYKQCFGGGINKEILKC